MENEGWAVDSGHPLTPLADLQGLPEMLGSHTDGHIQKHVAWLCQSLGGIFTPLPRVNAVIFIPGDDDEMFKNSKSSFS